MDVQLELLLLILQSHQELSSRNQDHQPSHGLSNVSDSQAFSEHHLFQERQ